MRLLLDTQVFLWFVADSRRLSAAARREIQDAQTVLVSAASIWEAAIKIALGKLAVSATSLAEAIGRSGFTELPVLARHAARVVSLPDLHRDPFDRLLIAQAMDEQLRFLTADAPLGRYSDLVKVV